MLSKEGEGNLYPDIRGEDRVGLKVETAYSSSQWSRGAEALGCRDAAVVGIKAH